jgi:hypothetical protein
MSQFYLHSPVGLSLSQKLKKKGVSKTFFLSAKEEIFFQLFLSLVVIHNPRSFFVSLFQLGSRPVRRMPRNLLQHSLYQKKKKRFPKY